jgi:chaperone required for assembly of F1-ATPase
MTQLGKGQRAINRFYKEVSVVEADSHAFEAGLGYEIHLDGRPAKTPARSPLATNNHKLATAIAEEWRAQGEKIDTRSMPLTRLLTTAYDLGPAQREKWVDDIVSYLDNDLLAYRAISPEELIGRQQLAWDPLIEALRGHPQCDIALAVGQGVGHIVQPSSNAANARARLDICGNQALISLKTITEITGSAVLALNCLLTPVDKAIVFAASRIDEDFQAERWGADAEAQARASSLKREFDAAFRFLKFFLNH